MRYPLVVVEGGAITEGRVLCVVGGMANEGRAAMPVPPVCVLESPFRLRGGPIEWRGAVCAVVSPCSDWAWRLVLSCFPLHCLAPLVLCVVGGEVWWGVS